MSNKKTKIEIILNINFLFIFLFICTILIFPITGIKAQNNINPEYIDQSLITNKTKTYTVKKGDTLWDIAKKLLFEPWQWPEIWYINPQIENPHLIYPGDILALIQINGKNQIIRISNNTKKLSPQIRVNSIDTNIKTIPYEKISSFINKSFILDKKEISDLPYILAIRDDHLIAAAGNEVYVRGDIKKTPGSQFNIINLGEPLNDPDTGEILGYFAMRVGKGILSSKGDPSTFLLTETTREVLIGNRIAPIKEDISLDFFPRKPKKDIEGKIIAVIDDVSIIGKYQVVAINRGELNELVPGDVLNVYRSGRTIVDNYQSSTSNNKIIKLPDEKIGSILIFTTHKKMSYALVMESINEIKIFDSIQNQN